MSEQTKVTAPKPIDEVRDNLVRMSSQFKMVLPPQVPLDRFLRIIVTAVNASPKLLSCDRGSLYAACMRAAQDGLLPDGREAALVPFKNTVQYLPMVGGILKKVRNSGELGSIAVEVIYQHDRFRYWIDSDGPHIEHEPLLFGERGEVLGAYALAKTTDGFLYVEAMSKVQIEKVRAVSAAAHNGPWVDWWDEMAKKTVIRRLAKRLPMSTDADGVFDREDKEKDVTPESESPKTLPPPGEPKRKQRRIDSIIETAPTVSASANEAAASPDTSKEGDGRPAITPLPGQAEHPTPEEAAALEVDKMMEKKT